MHRCCYCFDGLWKVKKVKYVVLCLKLWLNYTKWGEHLTIQLWWATARLVVVCLGSINPLTGLLSVRSRWCAEYEILSWRERCLFRRKLTWYFMLVNVLKNMTRMTRRLCVLIMSHTRFTVNLLSLVVWMSRKSLLETDVISEI